MRFHVAASALGGILVVTFPAPRILAEARASDEGTGGAAEREMALANSGGTSDSLRGRRLAYEFDCGCPTTCTDQALNVYGGQYKCGGRIEYLVSTGWGRSDACHQVAGVEFPVECGGCDPQSCPQEPAPSPNTCGCDSCTTEVLAMDACDGNGCFSCGSRLNWLMNDVVGPLLPERDACIRLSWDEFPDGPCGPACDPTRCNVNTDAPTSSPTADPTEIPTHAPTEVPTPVPTVATTASPTGEPIELPTPPPADTGPSPCGCEYCTQDVLDTFAGDYKCGARMNWLQTADGGSYSESAACGKVAGEFPTECGACDPVTCNPVYLPDPIPAKMVWSDEFDTDGPLDPARWTYDIGGGGYGNNELQHYTDRIDNSYISNGILHIRAVKENYGGNDFTSARAVTRGLGDWTYGRIRVRARMAQCTGLGTWPAIWMLPTEWKYGGWPASGEIDIMEHVGYDTGRVHGTVHTEAFNHMIGTQVGKSIFTDVANWHIYEIVWDVDKIEFAMDGVKYHEFARVQPPAGSYKEWPFDENFHLIFNVAVGGNWGGVMGVDSSAFEGQGQIMELDWVRVYSL